MLRPLTPAAAGCSSQRPASSFSCLRVPHKEMRYCTIRCKTSPGLDHHCSWVNTCIGERNYEAFYCLTIASTLQTALQTVVGVLMCTLWLDEVRRNSSDDWHLALTVLLWAHNACAFSLGNSYLLLAGFHTYLLYVGTGTYDFILENGREGLCARMLKCNCLRRSKRKKANKRSHVRAAADDDDPSAVAPNSGKAAGAKLSRRGSPTAAAKAAMQASAGPKFPVNAREAPSKWKAPTAPTEAASKTDNTKRSKRLDDKTHVEVNLNESEGIFQQEKPEEKASPSPRSTGPKTDL